MSAGRSSRATPKLGVAQFFLSIAWLGFAGVLGASALALLARELWIGELAANLRWQIGEVAALVAVLCLCLRARRSGMVALALAAFHLTPALALCWHREPPACDGPSFTVASSNLLYSNREGAKLRAWLAHDSPDVIAFSEVTGYWFEELRALSAEYPYQLLAPPPDVELGVQLGVGRGEVGQGRSTWGLALISRFPLHDARVRDEPAAPDPFLEADVIVHGARVHVIALHPERPGRAARTALRNATLAYVAQNAHWTDESIVLGDLNASLYSPAFEDFVERAGLADSRQGFGRQPTWNPPLEIPGRWVDIDHILVRPGIAVLDRRVGDDIGSDHLPVLARVSLVRAPAPPKP